MMSQRKAQALHIYGVGVIDYNKALVSREGEILKMFYLRAVPLDWLALCRDRELQ
jgi:hypothetical protein